MLTTRCFWPQCCGEKGTPGDWIYQYDWLKSWSWIPDELGAKELIWVQNQNDKLHGNGLFYDVQVDREEQSPIPESELTSEPKVVYRMFAEAIATMPATNPTYQEKTKQKQATTKTLLDEGRSRIEQAGVFWMPLDWPTVSRHSCLRGVGV
ncbi:hypothetical protein Q31b_39340 [Novipirellula aureliae]|uniref:Uncharacterized protein n=1 Tax=Novipirellula aureliae TaxID=2527966 RepID=A0A5C6DUW6_9BACT|nr:hypothetical protein [Novipirellula aureliae]TWU38856.1 hypothetical protein Q31b_39340 [Novipirellula aureliae]